MIQCIELAENVLCIYRNYLFCKKEYNFFIMFRIVIEVIIYSLLVLNNLIFLIDELQYSNGSEYVYFAVYVMFFFDVFLGFFSVYKSVAYKNFIHNLVAIHNVYNKNINYNRNIKRMQILLFGNFTVILIIAVYLIVDITYYLRSGSNWDTMFICSVIYSLFRNEITYALEFMALYTFLSILTSLLKCLNNTILEIQENVQSKEELNIETSHSVLVEKLTRWAEVYQYLLDASKQLSACFKNHVNIMK